VRAREREREWVACFVDEWSLVVDDVMMRERERERERACERERERERERELRVLLMNGVVLLMMS